MIWGLTIMPRQSLIGMVISDVYFIMKHYDLMVDDNKRKVYEVGSPWT